MWTARLLLERMLLLLVPLALLVLPALLAPAVQAAPSDWPQRLEAELARINQGGRARIGVYVRDLDSGLEATHRADDIWYLASTVKVPVALAVLRAVERGGLTLDTTLTLRAGDAVDGGGVVNAYPPGATLSVRFLLEQMIVHSDNTASDMLIGLVGLQDVNALVQQAVPKGFERITTLADVRRQIYSRLTPQAQQLVGSDFLHLARVRDDAARVQRLARLLDLPLEQFTSRSLPAAYAGYYASRLNSGRLRAYGDLLAQLADGRLLNAEHTAHLLQLMERIQTGQRRLVAGLPAGVRLAHKTGTQRERSCDSGLLTARHGLRTQRVVIVACTRGEAQPARSDNALRQVALALCHSGLFNSGTDHAVSCRTATPVHPALVPDTEPDVAER